MTANITTIDDFCFSLRLKFEEWRIDAWELSRSIEANPAGAGQLDKLAQVVAQAVTLAANTRAVIDAQRDPEIVEWLCWAETSTARDLAEIKRAYRVAQFHADPTTQTMSSALGWCSERQVSEARSRWPS